MKEDSVEKRLAYLYALQQIDLQLQEIHELKGDLPGIVAELEEKTNALQAKIKELNNVMKTSKIERDNADVEIISLTEKMEKYRGQQLQVKNNKQYDALSKEIDGAEEKIKKLETEMETLEGKINAAKTDLEGLSTQFEESDTELTERQKDLREVNKEHEKEETKFRKERVKISSYIDKPDLTRYERISKAKGGNAIVALKRDSCGGCFNRIPPQKILELRQNSFIYNCEHCGRIVVSNEIVEKSTSLA